ncbi:MAG: LVIVD repeat-containing protein [Candidatus Helarchaeota archaeon]
MRLKNFSLIFLLVLFFQFPLIAFAFQIVLAEGSYESGSGPIGTWTPGGTSSSIEDVVSNSVYAFVAISGGSENGLAILDLSDKANPTKIGSLTTSDTVHSIELVNGIIALGAGSKLLFINISDPSNPTLIKNLTLHSTVYDLQEMGYFLAVGDYSGSLYVVNVTDTSNATIIWGYSDNPDPNNRWIQGLTSFFGSNYVYAAALSNGLHVWNLSDPSNPALIGSLNLGYSM